MLLAGEISCADSSKSDYAINYVHSLHQNGKFSLCVWNPHCLVGTWGHNVQHEILDAINFWEDGSRYASYIIKGKNPCTEHYSALKAEFSLEADAGTKLNRALIKALDSHDTIVTAGEALSHCVANTVRDLPDAGIAAKKSCCSQTARPRWRVLKKKLRTLLQKWAQKGFKLKKAQTYNNKSIKFIAASLLIFSIFLVPQQAHGQVQVVGAITDVNGILHKMELAEVAFDSPASIKDFIDENIHSKIKTDFLYRINFIGWVASQYGLKTESVNLSHLIETNNSLTSFFNTLEETSGAIKWTREEISKKYGDEFQNALTQSANSNLFMLIFETYLQHKRGELGW